MAKTSGEIRSEKKGGGKSSPTVDLQSVKQAILDYARVNHWTQNSQVSFEEDIRSVIDSVADAPKLGFASQVAQTVKKYNYKVSEKQAYVIAKAATEGKIGVLYNPDRTIKAIFKKWNPKTKKLE